MLSNLLNGEHWFPAGLFLIPLPAPNQPGGPFSAGGATGSQRATDQPDSSRHPAVHGRAQAYHGVGAAEGLESGRERIGGSGN